MEEVSSVTGKSDYFRVIIELFHSNTSYIEEPKFLLFYSIILNSKLLINIILMETSEMRAAVSSSWNRLPVILSKSILCISREICRFLCNCCSSIALLLLNTNQRRIVNNAIMASIQRIIAWMIIDSIVKYSIPAYRNPALFLVWLSASKNRIRQYNDHGEYIKVNMFVYNP